MEAGSPQVGVTSPLLVSIYLHHVLDVWFEVDVKPRLVASSFLLRYADDVVLVFANEKIPHGCWRCYPSVLPGSALHPCKAVLVDSDRAC